MLGISRRIAAAPIPQVPCGAQCVAAARLKGARRSALGLGRAVGVLMGKSMVTQKTRMIVAAACGLMLAACGQQEAPPPAAPAEPAPSVQAPADLSREELNSRRVADLASLNNALQAYHERNNAYPVTPQGGFTNVVANGAEWIPGLVPDFIAALPREPRMSDDPQQQYWYSSNGTDFKLIVVGVISQCGAEVERDGVRIDPARRDANGCWGYGFWTSGRRDF